MEKAANDLLKKATKANQTQTRDAALQILLSLKKENSTKLLLSALKDGNKEYRNAALNFASDFANKEVYIEVMKAMQKAKPEVKVDIINWIGREAKCPSKHDVIKSLELRFDLTAMQVLLAQLKLSTGNLTGIRSRRNGTGNSLVDITIECSQGILSQYSVERCCVGRRSG